MSLKLEEKGYIRESLYCPNCNTGIILYLDDKGTIRKAYCAEILKDSKIKCKDCESIFSYQPEKTNQ